MAENEETSVRTIEELTAEFERLNKRKIQAETQLKGATETLDTLEKEAVENFGTSKIEDLKKMLTRMEKENEDRRSEYQALLEGISSSLRKLDDDNTSDDTIEKHQDD